MNITGIGHIMLSVHDMEAAFDYYCGKLGCTHAFSIKNDDGKRIIEYLKIAPGQFIELSYADNPNNPAGGSYQHLCLLTDDIHALAEKLDALGILDSAPVQGRTKSWQCWSSDPEGNRIEFMQITPDSDHANA